jgi:hypothetical protein
MVRADRLAGATFTAVIARHRARLDGSEELLGPGVAELHARLQAFGRSSTEFLVSRCLLEPLSDAQVRAIRERR